MHLPTPVRPSVPRTLVRVSVLAIVGSMLAGCHRAPASSTTSTPEPAPLTLPATLADSVTTERLPSGARLHTIVNRTAPWRAVVLEADLRCHALQAVKGAPTSVGRATTSALLAGLPAAARAVAAVNADFFLFAPPGVLTNAHIEDGRLITGPDVKPVVWVGVRDPDGGEAFGIDTLRVDGSLTTPRGSIVLTGWNRPAARSSGVLDAAWGVAPDSLVRARSWRLAPVGALSRAAGPSLSGRFVVVAPWAAGDSAARGDSLWLHLAARDRAAVTVGDTVSIALRITGTGPRAANAVLRQAVAGRPLLVVDSVLAPDVDTEGQASFRDLNPRTAMGFDRTGRRVWLAVIDGRQKERSMGMTLRQTGELLRALGAVRAINLDGGGSSALVVRDATTGATRVTNTPSDPTGERPVGNALVVRDRCGR